MFVDHTYIYMVYLNTMESTLEKKGGKIRNLEIRPYTLTLEEKYAEWARTKPGGISGIARAALKDAYLSENPSDHQSELTD